MFVELRNRYCLKGRLICGGAVHVGSGAPEGESDMPVVRDRNQRPFIPGSSLRGAMRSLVERAMATLQPEGSCILFDAGSHNLCPTASKTARDRLSALMDQERVDEARAILLGREPTEGRLCDTCRLFGSPFAASKLKVFDLPLCVGSPDGSVRHGVGIDRDEGKAREKIKFEYEVLERGEDQTEFELEIVGENLGRLSRNGNPPADPDFALIGLAWRQASHYLSVGGKSSSGLGRCKLELRQVLYFDNDTAHGLRRFLTATEDDGYASLAPAEFLRMITEQLHLYLGTEAPHA
jgi:CRISPR-associated protein Csm3